MFKSKLMRVVVSRWGRARRGMTLGVRVIARDAEGRVMLVRHGYAPGWHLPGGGVEVGETAETSAFRELLEETGLSARRLSLVGLYFNPAFGGRDHVAVYRAEAFDAGPAPAPNREIAERGWFAANSLPETTTPATRRRLEEADGARRGDGRW